MYCPKNAAESIGGTSAKYKLLGFLLVFALLISNTAACFASGLAGCLAFAAATVLSAVAKVLCFKCLNMFHCFVLLNIYIYGIIPYIVD